MASLQFAGGRLSLLWEIVVFSQSYLKGNHRRMEQSRMARFKAWLADPIDPYMLAILRIGYGILMMYNMFRYFKIGLIRNMFVLPRVNFHYDFLYWVKPLPEVYMNLILGLLFVCAFCIAAGLVLRWAGLVFAIGYAYIFLIDKSIYNNHIYLFILIAFLFSFTDADRVLSLGRKKTKEFWIQRWQIVIFQAQIVIVYFYGGIAKLTKDWLINCQPVRYLVEHMGEKHLMAPLLKNEAAIYILNYGGLLLDLGAPLLLWYKPFRKWAVYLFIGFNSANSRIFSDIGIFPYTMLFVLLIFYETRELPGIRRLLNRPEGKGMPIPANAYGANSLTLGLRPISPLIYGYFVFQLLFPFRGHFLPNPLDWTTVGNRFSWRMKVDTREGAEKQFFIHSDSLPQPVPVDIHSFINDVQIRNLEHDPRSIADFARFLKSEALVYHTPNPQITANVQIRYNGRPPQYFVNPKVNLAEVEYKWYRKMNWVYPVPKY